MAETLLQNNILNAAEQKIEGQLTTKNREDYMRIVVAGMKLALKGGPQSILASLKESKDPLNDIVNGTIGMMGMMIRESRNSMPMMAAIPAAMTLMLKALDTADRMGLMKVGKAELEQATKLLVQRIMPKLGVTQDKFKSMSSQVHGIMSDPAKMAVVNKIGGGQDAGND